MDFNWAIFDPIIEKDGPPPPPFKKWVRKICLIAWKDLFGWRRYFIVDWWRVKLGLRVTTPCPMHAMRGEVINKAE